MADDAGTKLDGRIELKGLLGAGGMGEVHRAWDHALERPVAVKFFHGTSTSRNAERLMLEGKLQARVEHPHVVRVLDVGTLAGRFCLVLQLVEGRGLDVVASTLTREEQVELVRQAALGVHAAHLEGLVHRDVKPGNVLVEQGPGAPRALVTDFGLARGDEPGLTRTGLVPGTLAFMSPEQLSGGPVGFASDVYGLSATLLSKRAGAVPGRAPLQPSGSRGAGSASRLASWQVLQRCRRGGVGDGCTTPRGIRTGCAAAAAGPRVALWADKGEDTMTTRATVGSMMLALAMVVTSGCGGPGGSHDGTNDPAYWSAPVRMACYQDLSRNDVPTQRSCTAWWTNNAVLGKALTESWRLICDSAMGKVVDGCPAEDMVGRCTDTTSGTSSFAQEVVSYAPVSTTASARKKCSAVFTAP